jgi:Tissue inhibitor of metalloproteinase
MNLKQTKTHCMYKIALIIAIFAMPFSGTACSCMGVSHIESSVKAADAVFEGSVLSSKKIAVMDKDFGYFVFNYMQYKIKVSQGFKNAKRNKIITVTTGMGRGDCGFQFLMGKKYIFYTQFENRYYNGGPILPKYLSTNTCTRTKKTDAVECKLIKDFVKYGRIDKLYSDF